ncbi:MAG: hypothetical protein AABN95_17790 [Acidobacteriota bacterium]
MSTSLSTGTKLGRYEIRSQIGVGGMGEVYLALDTELDRTVGIRVSGEVVQKRADTTSAEFKVDPYWDGIRGDPRFADLMRRFGLPQ